MTYAHAAEKVSDGGSGRSRVANTDRDRIPAERLQPKVAYYAGDPDLALDLSREAGAQLSAAIHACGSRRAPRAQQIVNALLAEAPTQVRQLDDPGTEFPARYVQAGWIAIAGSGQPRIGGRRGVR